MLLIQSTRELKQNDLGIRLEKKQENHEFLQKIFNDEIIQRDVLLNLIFVKI